MNDDIRRSWAAANRFDAPRHPFPWRAVRNEEPTGRCGVRDADGAIVALTETLALAECIAALPELMGEHHQTPAQGLTEPKTPVRLADLGR